MNLLNRPRARRIANAVISDPEEHTVIDERGARALGPGRRPRRCPEAALDEIWSPMHLERLARTYWRFLSRVHARAHPRRLHRGRSAPSCSCAPARAAALQGARSTRWTRPRHRALADRRRRCSSPRGRNGDGYLQIDVRRCPAGRAGPCARCTSRSRSRTSTRRSRVGSARRFYRAHAVAHPRARDLRLPALARAARPRGVARRALRRPAARRRRRGRPASRGAGHGRRHAVGGRRRRWPRRRRSASRRARTRR